MKKSPSAVISGDVTLSGSHFLFSAVNAIPKVMTSSIIPDTNPPINETRTRSRTLALFTPNMSSKVRAMNPSAIEVKIVSVIEE